MRGKFVYSTGVFSSVGIQTKGGDVMEAWERIIVALDVDEFGEAVRLTRLLNGRAGMFKIGLHLFSPRGGETVRHFVLDAKARVFLDLKFHDIPNTVEKASEWAARLGVSMFNVHCSGGVPMMKAAKRGASRAGANKPLVLGVTILTSHTYESILWTSIGEAPRDCHNPACSCGGEKDPEENFKRWQIEKWVLALAQNASFAGLDGVVASPQETRAIRQEFGDGFIIVTPGIRFEGEEPGDQRRIATPGAAVAAGADYIVVGRSITAAKDPVGAAERAANEIATALAERG